MSTIAIFMGAGASKPFGFPLTNELLYLIKERLESGTLFLEGKNSRKDAIDLQNYLYALFPGLCLKDIDLPSITDILSLIDHSLYVSYLPLPGRSTSDIVKLRTLLERAIFEVLEWPYGNDTPRALLKLIDWLQFLSRHEGYSVGIISTNYDIAVETELFNRYRNNSIEKEFDFGVSWRDPVAEEDIVYKRPAAPSFRIYKLHGSLNWLRCDMCEHIYINTAGIIAHWAFKGIIDEHNTCHCGHSPLRSVLIAPSLVRDIRDGNLLEVWKHALELLRTASEWIIIGYSFPPEDVAIRSLFIRAYHGRQKAPKINVIQSGNNRFIYSRYRMFFPDCIYKTEGLEGFLSELQY